MPQHPTPDAVTSLSFVSESSWVAQLQNDKSNTSTPESNNNIKLWFKIEKRSIPSFKMASPEHKIQTHNNTTSNQCHGDNSWQIEPMLARLFPQQMYVGHQNYIMSKTTCQGSPTWQTECANIHSQQTNHLLLIMKGIGPQAQLHNDKSQCPKAQVHDQC